MGKRFAVLATVAAFAAAAMTVPAPAGAGDRPAFGPVAGGLTAGAALPYDYDGYVYGPLPYGRYYGQRVHPGSRMHHVARVRHMARADRALDPYYGGGPFYHRHSCCRYW